MDGHDPIRNLNLNPGDDHDHDHDDHGDFVKNFVATNMKFIDAEIVKIKMKHDHQVPWTIADRMTIYSRVYEWVVEAEYGPERDKLLEIFVEKYERTSKDRIFQMVIPSLIDKKENLEFWDELKEQWSKYDEFTKDVIKIFYYTTFLFPTPQCYDKLSQQWFCELVNRSNGDEFLDCRILVYSVFKEKIEINTLWDLVDN